VLGTLRYLAPERVSGRADARADIYGLGATLYELICAQPAFVNAGRAVLLRQVLDDEPPRLRSIEPWVPRDLETIVLTATSPA
jgi:serine/threonine protein kinase